MSEAQWRPEDAQVLQIVHLLEVLYNPAAASQHRQAQAALDAFMSNPEFGPSLAYMFAQPLQAVPPSLRQLAGLVLKNVVKSRYTAMPPGAQQAIQARSLQAARDPERPIRMTAGSVISTVLSQSDVRAWPGLLPALVDRLDSEDEAQVEGSLDTLLKVCEEGGAAPLDSEEMGRPLNVLVPKMLALFSHSSEVVRKYALGCINNLLGLMPQALVVHMAEFLQGLSALASDQSAGIRQLVCKAIVTLAQVDPKLLMPNMEGFCRFMLTAMTDPEHSVAIEAGEFWQAYCDIAGDFSYGDETRWEEMAGVLPQLVPVLLDGMVYSADDVAEFATSDVMNAAGVPDRPEDLRPAFHRGKGQGAGGEDEVDEWNLRKCSASALDSIAETFGQEKVLPVLLPCLEERLGSQNVWVRESALLALGAVAPGCMDGLVNDLPKLLHFLVTQVEDGTPQIRSIACWTLSRYSSWIFLEDAGSAFREGVLHALTRNCLDEDKRVQEAACSAFATVADVAGGDLEPALPHILERLVAAMRKYQKRNLIYLYDTIGTLADSVGPGLATPQFNGTLVPLLMEKWSDLADDDSQAFPLLECLTSVAQAMGASFQNHAVATYERCCRIIEQAIMHLAAVESKEPNGHGSVPEKEFIVCSLDLLSGMTEGLGAGMEMLVASNNLLAILWECMKDSDASVKQSAFALLGELAKACMPRVMPALPQYIHECSVNLRSSQTSTDQHVCTNVAWAIGEIASHVDKATVDSFVQPIVAGLVDVFLIEDISVVPETLLSTIAVTLGRLGRVSSALMAPSMERYIGKWCHCVGFLVEAEEKECSCLALCQMIRENPHAVVNDIGHFCMAVASWHDANFSPELAENFRDVLGQFKDPIKVHWQKFPPPVRDFLLQFLQ